MAYGGCFVLFESVSARDERSGPLVIVDENKAGRSCLFEMEAFERLSTCLDSFFLVLWSTFRTFDSGSEDSLSYNCTAFVSIRVLRL